MQNRIYASGDMLAKMRVTNITGDNVNFAQVINIIQPSPTVERIILESPVTS